MAVSADSELGLAGDDRRTAPADLVDLGASSCACSTSAVNVRYSRAKALASEQTGLQASTFPSKCPYAVHEIIDFDFLPGRNA
jgi:hypothetical protein